VIYVARSVYIIEERKRMLAATSCSKAGMHMRGKISSLRIC